MKNMLLIMVSLFLMLVLSACNIIPGGILGDDPPAPDVGSEGNIVIVTPAIGPNSAQIQVGDILELQLATIPTEGFEWVVDEIDTNILVQEANAEYAADPSPDSAGGTVTFNFLAVGVGKTTLSLIYVSEATDESPSFTTNSFSITVTVTEARDSTVVFSAALGENKAALNVGDDLEVQIPTIPVDGYEWVITEVDNGILVQKGSAQYADDTGSKPDGRIVTFIFTAVGKGTTNLTFEYVTVSTEDGPALSSNSYGLVVEVK